MPSTALQQIERRLTELACPPALLRRKLRELAEHHEDLKHDALEDGLSDTDAEARADDRLGEPFALASQLAAALRQASWWGRHPVVGFVLLPPFAVIALYVLFLYAEFGLGRIFYTEKQLGAFSEAETSLKYCQLTVQWTYYVAVFSAAIGFSIFARRVVTGFTWTCVACFMCALHAALFFVKLAPHNITFGFTSDLHWLAALLPLGVAALLWLKLRRDAGRFPPLPAVSHLSKARSATLPPLPRTRFLNPTSVITMLLTAIIAFYAICAYTAYRRLHSQPDVMPAKAALAKPTPAARQ
jgi:hypothetical protein